MSKNLNANAKFSNCLSRAVMPEVRDCQRGVIMTESFDFRTRGMALEHGAGNMPVLGFGTLIPDLP